MGVNKAGQAGQNDIALDSGDCKYSKFADAAVIAFTNTFSQWVPAGAVLPVKEACQQWTGRVRPDAATGQSGRMQMPLITGHAQPSFCACQRVRTPTIGSQPPSFEKLCYQPVATGMDAAR